MTRERRPPDDEGRQESNSGVAGVESLMAMGRLRVATNPADLPLPIAFTGSWDRLEGMMLGLAVGDSLGNSSESMNPSNRSAAHGEILNYLPHRHAGMRAVGVPSDDTQMAFWTLEHLLERGALDPEGLSEMFAAREIFGMGSTVRAFRGARKPGAHWIEASQRSAGNGAVMRIAPVLLPHARGARPDFWCEVVLAGTVTHNDFASNAACAGWIGLLARAAAAQPPVPQRFWLDGFLEVARAIEGETPRYTPRAPRFAGLQTTLCDFTGEVVSEALSRQRVTLDACNEWYSGAFLLETIPSALYVLERHGNEAEEAVVRAVNDTRDNDTVAALVGAAVGALHGASRLPNRWVSGLLGRTGRDDDGHVHALLEEARRAWG